LHKQHKSATLPYIMNDYFDKSTLDVKYVELLKFYVSLLGEKDIPCFFIQYEKA
jgi:hypothetical protein